MLSLRKPWLQGVGAIAVAVSLLVLVAPDASAQCNPFREQSLRFGPAQDQACGTIGRAPAAIPGRLDASELSGAHGTGNAVALPYVRGDEIAVQLWDEWQTRKVANSVGQSFSASTSGHP